MLTGLAGVLVVGAQTADPPVAYRRTAPLAGLASAAEAALGETGVEEVVRELVKVARTMPEVPMELRSRAVALALTFRPDDREALVADGQLARGVKAAEFRPTASVFKGETCQGVRLTVRDAEVLPSVTVGMTLAAALVAQHGKAFDADPLNRLLAHEPSLAALKRGASAAEVMATWEEGLAAYRKRRAAFLRYSEGSV